MSTVLPAIDKTSSSPEELSSDDAGKYVSFAIGISGGAELIASLMLKRVLQYRSSTKAKLICVKNFGKTRVKFTIGGPY